ncbi:DUF2986 domain-containing protein [Shewanella profunda]|uniref:DUF2986 domain-containing protein n=1 Tax=Shewanella profunda TaxID=254793 RepID=UPI00200BBEFC|nr:DUF2986 domain-containing protein [Shewanella profunda]MCL1091954.1 DUF2986 domain-containing protein [Shewanella profunda]
MNKKQKIIKKIAKRAKARLNKVDPVTIGSPAKSGYISKAERARLDALDVPASTQDSQIAETDSDAK